MMKTWVGPAWTGSGSGFIDSTEELASPKQASISTSAMVRLCVRREEGGWGLCRAVAAAVCSRPAVVRRSPPGGHGWCQVILRSCLCGRAGLKHRARRRRAWWRMPKKGRPLLTSRMLDSRGRSRQGALGCKLHLPGSSGRVAQWLVWTLRAGVRRGYSV
jgi:hypothetical protein